MTLPAFITLLAAAAQMALTLWSIVAMGRARIAHIRSGALKLKDIALDDTLWPDEIKKLQANNRNQYETPILFYAAIALALAIGAANWGVALFSWAYVMSRIIHRTIHVGSNDVRSRFNAFLAGLIALAGLWISLLAGALN